jgi:adenylate cyclase
MKLLTPKNQLIFKRVAPFSILWTVFSFVYVLLERGIIGKGDFYPATGNSYDFNISLPIITIGGLFLGSILGFIEVFVIKNWFQNFKFLGKLILKALFYLICLLLFLIISAFIINSRKMDMPFYSLEVAYSIKVYINNFVFLAVLIYAFSIISTTIFISELTENLGTKVVFNFLLGRYHKPVKEKRVFMFLDMRSSTSHAERLGNEKYFALLQKYYEDLNKAILNSYAEIYQYVGDEIVLSWNLSRDNVLPCKCFYDMKEVIRKNNQEYYREFGFVPEFKAGIHLGEVMSGKVGVIQKEVLFTGDVLNTTSRIQNLCNSYGVDILVSQEFMHHINLPENLSATEIGSVELRGKEKPMKLFTLHENQERVDAF